MESTETISPSRRSARSRATWDFPTAVGPARRSSGGRSRGQSGDESTGIICGGLRRTRGRGAWEFQEQNQPGQKHGHADELRGSQGPRQVTDWIIAPKRFDNAAGHRVANQVTGKDLAVEFLAPMQPGQESVKSQAQERIVNLRGMHSDAMRFMIQWKMDGPRQGGLASVAAAV